MLVRLAGLVAAFVLLLCATASAAAPAWHSALISTEGEGLRSASCSTPTLCIAVGELGTAVVEDGTYQYKAIADPDGNQPSLNSISCVPGKRFCMAVDSRGAAVEWVDGIFGNREQVAGARAAPGARPCNCRARSCRGRPGCRAPARSPASPSPRSPPASATSSSPVPAAGLRPRPRPAATKHPEASSAPRRPSAS